MADDPFDMDHVTKTFDLCKCHFLMLAQIPSAPHRKAVVMLEYRFGNLECFCNPRIMMNLYEKRSMILFLSSAGTSF